jgi:Flp pilus assembly protein TadG
MNSRGTPTMKFCALAKRALRPLARENSGVAAIEFAICSTIFLTAVAGTVDIGLLLYTEFQLDTAVNAGAQYAVNNAAMVGSSPSTLNTDISNLVNNLNGTGWATSTVNVNNGNDTTGCYCPSGTPGNWTWGSTVTCGNSCASGGGIGGQFVTITANRGISPIFTAFGFVSSGTVSRSVLVETQ